MLSWVTACRSVPRSETGGAAAQTGVEVVVDIAGKSMLGDPPIENPAAGSVLSGGRIVVADAGNKSLRFFSPKGDLTATIGREGAGPGEFQSVPWVRQCAPDSLFVWDPMLSRVSVFDPLGKFTREFRLPGRPGLVECSASGVLAIIMQPEDLRRPDPNGTAPRLAADMIITDTRGESHSDVGEVTAFENRPGGKRTRIAVGADQVFLGTQDSAAVEQVNRAGRVVGALPVGIAGRPMTRQAYEHAIDLLARQLVVSDEREAYRQSMLKFPAPKELPPYFELFADTTGTLWAQISVPGSGNTVLSRLAADGRALSDVQLPKEIRVFEVGTDYVLGSYEDGSDIPHVVLFRVEAN